MNATRPVVRWLVRPYESDEWLITTEPPTDELRRWFEFKKFTPDEPHPPSPSNEQEPQMNATQQFARASGYTGHSKAILAAFEAIRQNGITEARAAHCERVKLVEKYKAEPGMFFAAIRPNLSTEEAIEDANRIIFRFRNLESWRQESRRGQVLQAKQTRVIARFFRRFGQRVWMERAA